MKPFREYRWADWRRLRPLTHRYKTARYQIVDAIYGRKPPRAGDPAAVLRDINGRRVLVTIAFHDAQAIEWQTMLVRHFLPDVVHIIADNSRVDTKADAIAKVAERQRLPYLRLPPNPWKEPSRSHGIALNWVWRNLIRPGCPAAFGFLDQDLFPTAAEDPFAPLASQDFYGLKRQHGSRWFLWAGYCTFRFEAVKDKPLDFGQDWFNGLDTGGGNWEVLYQHVPLAELQWAESEFLPYKPGVALKDGPLQWCGAWLHEVGVMGLSELASDKRRVVGELLAPHLSAAKAGAAHTKNS